MRQATGSNTPQSGNKVSIQLSLDGHSFSVPALSELPAGEAPVTVELLLPGTMLVPGELFDAERGAEMLAANGMPPTAEECVVASDPEAEFVAVTAINREALRQVEEKLGDRARFTTPLLHTPANTAKTVWMSRRAGLLYIKVYDGGELQLAEAIPAATDTDAAYFFERLFPVKGIRTPHCGRQPESGAQTARQTIQTDDMRIVSGKYRGRAINPPKNLRARPTTDFAKENLFNVLGNLLDFEECDVLDLFAGTGSISYEFASRGARSVTAVEINAVHHDFIRRTAALLGIENFYPVKANVFLYLKSCAKQFDVIFSDAPYDLEGSEQVVKLVLERGLLRPGGILIFEHSKKMDFSDLDEFWQLRSYGSVQFSFFKKP